MSSVLILFVFIFIVFLIIRKTKTRQNTMLKVIHSNQSEFKRQLELAKIKAPHNLQAHADLIAYCDGDYQKAERLIEVEQRQQSTLSRAQATELALSRLQSK